MPFIAKLESLYSEGRIDKKIYDTFLTFCNNYERSLLDEGLVFDDRIFETYLDRVLEQLQSPFAFKPFHRYIRKPFDYYQFGLEFTRPLLDLPNSKILHLENVAKMRRALAQGENVVLFANHQTELDPQLISLALEAEHEAFARDLIFVAGDRVINDPVAIPMSMGRNLLCIYSKRHIENPPEKKREKLLHNQRTMGQLKELFSEGGHAIYVAPSGGRDRINSEGVVEVAPFDSSSVEMMRLIASDAKKRCHFYPLALATYDILPPPAFIETEIGEERVTGRSSIRLSFCNEVDMGPYEQMERKERREKLALDLWTIVKQEYERIKA